MTGRRLSLLLAVMLFWAADANALPIVVKLRPSANLSIVTSLLGGTVIDSVPGANTYLLQVPALPVLTPLLRILGVDWLEADRSVSLPSAPLLARLDTSHRPPPDWYRRQPALRLIRADEALPYSTGRGIMVADINSQVDQAHPALVGHLTAGADFVSSRRNALADLNDDQSTTGFLDEDQSTTGFLDDGFDERAATGFLAQDNIVLSKLNKSEMEKRNGPQVHGTFCAGIIAVVAPDAVIMPLRAFDDNGQSDAFTIAKAIYYAKQQRVHVINMSFGLLSDARVLREAVESANAAHIVLVTSAGNNDTSAPQYPAAYAGVISVAATDLLDRKTSFSNYGRFVFVDAPGQWIISAIPDGNYGVGNGTSFSAAIVSGMTALIRSVKFGDVPDSISQSAVGIDGRNPRYAGQLGYGRVDVLAAVRPRNRRDDR